MFVCSGTINTKSEVEFGIGKFVAMKVSLEMWNRREFEGTELFGCLSIWVNGLKLESVWHSGRIFIDVNAL